MKIDDKKLCEIIKESRENKNISQRELARRLNVNNAVIARIENGETKKPSFQLLNGLSKELKIGLYNLLRLANYTEEEIDNLGYIELMQFRGVKDKQIVEDYMLYNYDGEEEFDIIKILQAYKNNKIDMSTFFGLMCLATGGIDLTKYIPEELKAQYGINASFVVIKDKKK